MVQEHDDMKERSERWTFLTNHGHALICIARDPTVRLRDVASLLGVTERTAQAIVNDLADGGYVLRTRVGNRSQYVVRASLPLRHPVERDHAVGDLIDLLAPGPAARRSPQGSPRHDA
jgi:hypothetical protein